MKSRTKLHGLLAGVILTGSVGVVSVPMVAQGVLGGGTDDDVAKVVEQLGSDSAALRESAEKKLEELGSEAIDQLKKYLAQAKADAKVDLELKLQNAIDRIQKGDQTDGEVLEAEEHESGSLRLRILPGARNGMSVRSYSVVEENGKRTVTESDGTTTTTLTQEDGGVIALTVEGNDEVSETKEFKDEDELKKERPEIYKLWKSEGGMRLELNPFWDQEVEDAIREAERESAESMREMQERLREMLEELRRQEGLLPHRGHPTFPGEAESELPSDQPSDAGDQAGDEEDF